MSCEAVREHRGWARAAAASLSLLLVSAVAGASLTEDELFRQVKVDVFDQAWPQVLRGCEEILERYPSGATAPQAAFYRARALTHIPPLFWALW